MKAHDLLLFRTLDKKVNVSVFFKEGTFWLTQKAMAELFGVDRTVITKHLKNIFETHELSEDSVCAIFAHTATDGKNYATSFYRLEAILAVGYRVNSLQATGFRKWATISTYQFQGINQNIPHNLAFGSHYLSLHLQTKTYFL